MRPLRTRENRRLIWIRIFGQLEDARDVKPAKLARGSRKLKSHTYQDMTKRLSAENTKDAAPEISEAEAIQVVHLTRSREEIETS